MYGFDPDYYRQELKATQNRVAAEATSKQSEFLRAILLSSTSMLGILVALHRTGESPLYIRLVFVVAILALTLGIVLTVSALYNSVEAYRELRRKTDARIEAAAANRFQTGSIAAGDDNVFRRLQMAAYISLAVGLLLLTLYAILGTLFLP